ncbi:MAG: Flp pilus assembly complex ATPase component TadA [Lachnospiraceae bacterium]|nr:Flp pilus assembly complex ATPase component TadA [Lachnospiraceae bacterium]
MNYILKYAIENNASDIHITQNKKSWVRVKGLLKQMGDAITVSNIDEFVELVTPELLGEYRKMREKKRIEPIDGAFKYMFRRFRINIYLGMDGINMALRLLSDKILTLDELYLPHEVEKFTEIKSGLFLVVGTTGSGKSTTLASMIDRINHSRSENILTVEQPIEYIHTSDRCRIEQIEVGIHVESFEMATVAAMRQNPNIILVGEMRDLETIQNAITLAETGHVVYGTLHAKSVTDTVDRIIDVFPPKQQEQIRIQLAGVLKGVMHQTLVRNKSGVVPLIELLSVDDVTSAMILGKQKSNTIRDHMRGKSSDGNVHIADNAVWHIQNSRLEIKSLKNILNLDDYAMVKSIVSTSGQRSGFYG